MGIRDRLKKVRKDRNRWRRLESEAATHVESLICLRTTFHGEPPYVGWKGLGLKLKEEFDRRDRMRAVLERLVAGMEEHPGTVHNMVVIGAKHDAKDLLEEMKAEDARYSEILRGPTSNAEFDPANASDGGSKP